MPRLPIPAAMMGAEEMARANGLHAALWPPLSEKLFAPAGPSWVPARTRLSPPCLHITQTERGTGDALCSQLCKARQRYVFLLLLNTGMQYSVLRTTYHLQLPPSCTAAQCDVFMSVGGAGRKLLRLGSFLQLPQTVLLHSNLH
jgi:hypothetical protein